MKYSVYSIISCLAEVTSLYILFHKLPKNVNKIGQKIFLLENFILILWREIYFPVLTNPSIIKVPFSSGIFLLNK